MTPLRHGEDLPLRQLLRCSGISIWDGMGEFEMQIFKTGLTAATIAPNTAP